MSFVCNIEVTLSPSSRWHITLLAHNPHLLVTTWSSHFSPYSAVSGHWDWLLCLSLQRYNLPVPLALFLHACMQQIMIAYMVCMHGDTNSVLDMKEHAESCLKDLHSSWWLLAYMVILSFSPPVKDSLSVRSPSGCWKCFKTSLHL